MVIYQNEKAENLGTSIVSRGDIGFPNQSPLLTMARLIHGNYEIFETGGDNVEKKRIFL